MVQRSLFSPFRNSTSNLSTHCALFLFSQDLWYHGVGKRLLPHFFNCAENQDYVGPLPDAMYYNHEGMNPGDCEKFYVWYNDLVNQDFVFDFQAKILHYCQSDVNILCHCCLEFCKLFRSITDIDPFAQCLTIASTYNLFFRKTFLCENMIAIIPHAVTPRKTNNRSSPSRCWPTSHSVTTLSSDILAIMANNVLENTSSMDTMQKQTPYGGSKAVYGTMSQVLCQRHGQPCQ